MSLLSIGYDIMNAAGLAPEASQFYIRMWQPLLVFINPRCDAVLLLLKLYAK